MSVEAKRPYLWVAERACRIHPNTTHWQLALCPFTRTPLDVEGFADCCTFVHASPSWHCIEPG